MNEKNFLLEKMTWPEVKERLKESNIAIVPIGSTEQHGPAIPFNNDAFLASKIAEKVADNIFNDVKTIVTPTIPFGFSEHHMDFPGSITLSSDTLERVVVDICKSLSHHGFKKIVILNGHGGNNSSLHNALYKIKKETDALVFQVNFWEIAIDVIKKVVSPPMYHACDFETSVSMALGQRVISDKLVSTTAKSIMPEFIKPDFFASPPTVEYPTTMKEMTETGNIGDSIKATPEKGEEILNAVYIRFEKFLRELNKL